MCQQQHDTRWWPIEVASIDGRGAGLFGPGDRVLVMAEGRVAGERLPVGHGEERPLTLAMTRGAAALRNAS